MRALLVLAALATVAASQAVTLTNVSAHPSVIRPSSGSVLASIFATVTANVPGETIQSTIAVPYTSGPDSTFLPSDIIIYIADINAALAATGTYAGKLFEFTIEPTTPQGVYDRTHDDSGPAYFTFFSEAGEPSVTESYSVTVSPVPEPGTFAALGLGVLASAKRRRRGLTN